ncbi:hypothetical protein [Gracilimonas mengyeensis]|uniref:Uncharacterized protein n=1 Tax=Gracilimonas mengyeensis TaxID=1302730 RepID=A0A521BF68_9BACT|nr:hypothetical protein [Gracilimonas mengyeensis]SMO45746.1 hypothetical protein SAMN06265219_102233 [Gracilimonas mengyeensis]
MAEFSLVDVQNKEDPLTGKVTFTESKSFRVIMGITAVLIISFFVLDFFELGLPEWTELLSLIALIVGYILAFFAYFFSRNAGIVTFKENQIEITPKRNPDQFPGSPIHLHQQTKIRINTMQSFQWFSSRVLLFVLITHPDGSEDRFGFMIKNKQKKQQYLEVLESWYRAGYKVEEHDQFGNRVFKINQGKSYEDVQKIKKEYGLDWK